MAERDQPRQFEPLRYEGASGGWGSVKGMAKVMLRQRPYPSAIMGLIKQVIADPARARRIERA